MVIVGGYHGMNSWQLDICIFGKLGLTRPRSGRLITKLHTSFAFGYSSGCTDRTSLVRGYHRIPFRNGISSSEITRDLSTEEVRSLYPPDLTIKYIVSFRHGSPGSISYQFDYRRVYTSSTTLSRRGNSPFMEYL